MTAPSPPAIDRVKLDATVSSLRNGYISSRPESHKSFQEAVECMPGGGTRSSIFIHPFPIFLKKAEGSILEDVDGNKMVDMQGDFSAGIYGHNNQVIQQAIIETLKDGIQLGTHTTHEAKLAQLITSRFPSVDLVRFANSGTEANLLAISTAIKYTGRSKVVVFEGGYHGSLLSHFEVEKSPVLHDSETEGGRKHEHNVLTAPYDFIICPYNDLSGTSSFVNADADDIAAIIVEPMLGAGGCVVGDPEFLKGLRDLSKEKGIVLIFDEVQTSRLSPGGRQVLLGISPDMTTFGKYFGGGFAFGAFGGSKEIMSMFDSRNPNALSHGGTYNNSVLTMVAGATGLSQVLTPAALTELNEQGDNLRDTLNVLFSLSNAPYKMTGLGSIMQVHVSPPSTTTGSDSLSGADKSTILDLIFFALLERGYHIAQRGLITLSLSLKEEQIAGFVDAVKGVLVEHSAVLGCVM